MGSELPGERAAWQIIHSPLASSDEKAAAQVKLAQVAEVRRGNAEREAEYRARQRGEPRFCPRRSWAMELAAKLGEAEHQLAGAVERIGELEADLARERAARRVVDQALRDALQ